MSSFAANKSMGGLGKIGMKNSQLVGALAVEMTDDIFMISKLGKLIRFQVDEVPTTEGAIQGVICMALRSDEVTAITRGMPFLS
jgi:DNA gyrase/topoisomerase IV subunit A